MKTTRLLLILGIVTILGLIVYFPGRKLARAHVNEKTAVTDHPLKCYTCHIYTSRNKYISKMMNEDYLSPFNMAVSKTGKLLFVVAQDADALLVVDTKNDKVLSKINVGKHPHSVILNKDLISPRKTSSRLK